MCVSVKARPVASIAKFGITTLKPILQAQKNIFVARKKFPKLKKTLKLESFMHFDRYFFFVNGHSEEYHCVRANSFRVDDKLKGKRFYL